MRHLARQLFEVVKGSIESSCGKPGQGHFGQQRARHCGGRLGRLASGPDRAERLAMPSVAPQLVVVAPADPDARALARRIAADARETGVRTLYGTAPQFLRQAVRSFDRHPGTLLAPVGVAEVRNGRYSVRDVDGIRTWLPAPLAALFRAHPSP